MNSNLIEKDLRATIIGCAMVVLNELGHGFREKTYEEAMIIEMQEKSLSVNQQTQYPVHYKNKLVDTFIPDLVIENKIIIELKTVDKICDEHIGQVLNYLKVTGLKVGIIFNFKSSKLEWKPIVL
ncbi:MAG: GxxExxY protein [Candidatus Tenebribacter mawsonii]|nr:GxxExxY protein [Candidatus Tenebribacter mawsonii]